VEEASVTDDEILVGLSGGHDFIPRQIRELAEAVTLDVEAIEDEEVIADGGTIGDETTEALLVPELERL
jgi:hypothetical protein